MSWPERFAAFSERKTSAATAAHLIPLRTQLEVAADDLEPIGTAWTRRMFDGSFHVARAGGDNQPASSLVFVQSLDGNTVADDPSMLGGGPTDEHLIYEGLSRVGADAVMAGAETLRGGDLVFSVWHPEIVALRRALSLPRHPAQVVATLRGLDIEGSLIFNVPEIPVFILSVGSCVELMQRAIDARPWVKPVPMQSRQDLPGAFAALRRAGIRRMSMVGGRTVARAAYGAGLVQDLYLTKTNQSGGRPDTPLFDRTPPHSVVVRKSGPGFTFEHWTLQPPGVPLLHSP